MQERLLGFLHFDIDIVMKTHPVDNVHLLKAPTGRLVRKAPYNWLLVKIFEDMRQECNLDTYTLY